METYHEIKKESENKLSELFKECRVFFAFSNEQFAENKTELKENEEYVSLGMGGYLPNTSVKNYIQGLKDITAQEKEKIKEFNLEKSEILYELQNHEAFYTGDIEDTYFALNEKYTHEQIWKVYRENYEKYAD